MDRLSVGAEDRGAGGAGPAGTAASPGVGTSATAASSGAGTSGGPGPAATAAAVSAPSTSAAVAPTGAGRRPGRGRLLGPGPDRDVLALWGLSRLAVAVLTGFVALVLSGQRLAQVPPPLLLWRRWDVELFRKVAELGYGGYPDLYRDRGIEAFFPGLPLLLRAVHAVLGSWPASGLLISAVAGAVAVVALRRLAALDGLDGRLPVVLLVSSPYAVFLAAPYSESLFLALAVPAWLAGRRDRWALAGLLAAGACTVRVNGLFLAAGLAVLALSRGRRRELAWLLLPVAALVGYAGYLHATTGDWLRWLHAQREGWGRRLTWPWDALAHTVDLARSRTLPAEYVVSYSAEVLAVVVGLVVTAVLLRRRRWAEATYVGLSVGALATSTFYLSVARATLLWFPLWLLLAEAAARRRWVLPAWLVLAGPLSVGFVLAFLSGRWVG